MDHLFYAYDDGMLCNDLKKIFINKMEADSVLWAAIAISTLHVSLTDISVIHGRHALGPKEKLNILLHQFIIVSALLGVFFQKKINIQAHIFVIMMCIVCWIWFNGCFMAQWQRNNIVYTPEEFTRIQKPKDKRLVQFLSMVAPLLIIDLYKLSRL